MRENEVKPSAARAETLGVLSDPRPRCPLSGGQKLAVGAWSAMTLGLVPAFVWLAPASRSDDPLLIVVLLALAVLADRSHVVLPNGVLFDASLALTVIAVALVGPLPALGVYLAPMQANAVTGRKKLLRITTLGNVAATGWYTLAAGAAVAAIAPAGTPVAGVLLASVVAGASVFYLGWALAPVIWAPLWLGVPVRSMLDSLRDMHPAGAVMIAIGAFTAAAYPWLGSIALALFAVVAVLPQSALTYAARSRPVGRLDPLTATRRYALALALQLGLSRTARRELDAVVRLADVRKTSGDPGEHLMHTVLDPGEVSCAAGHVTEWWNGAGGPAGLPGTIIPLASRIAAVAGTWAALTAQGSPQLGHDDALKHLDAAAGIRLDPRIVVVAHVVAAQERATAAVPAPDPRMHRLRIPAPVRRVLAAG